jgi:hypothetical protein
MVNNSDPLILPKVGATNDAITVSVILPIDPTLPTNPLSASEDLPLTIEVSQPVGADMVTRTLTGAVTLRTLPELKAAITDSMALKPMYSQVDFAAGFTFMAAAGKPAALIRSASTINLGPVNVNAAANVPGPGGQIGGAPGQPGGGNTSGGRGGVNGGGGGGFATAGGDGASGKGGFQNGDPLISSYTTNISAGGGGGGSVGGGAAGGGGGGTLELTAAGDVHVGAITADGGMGITGGVTGGGGGGAGGIVVIRSGGTATFGGAISAALGMPGGGAVGSAGAGSIGRTRVDAPVIAGAPAANPAFHRGASFDPATPFVFTPQTAKAGIKLFGTIADKFDVVVLDSAGGASSPAFTADFGNAPTITMRPTLQTGFNRVCVTKNGGSVTVAEATTCIDMAYLP